MKVDAVLEADILGHECGVKSVLTAVSNLMLLPDPEKDVDRNRRKLRQEESEF